ncbi:unnamed protein product [Gadus morhua 'NCC']
MEKKHSNQEPGAAEPAASAPAAVNRADRGAETPSVLSPASQLSSASPHGRPRERWSSLQENLLTALNHQENLLSDLNHQENLLTDLNQESLLTDLPTALSHQENLLTDLLTDLNHQDNLLSDLNHQENLLTDLNNQDNLLSDLLSDLNQENLLTDLNQESLLKDLNQENLLTDLNQESLLKDLLSDLNQTSAYRGCLKPLTPARLEKIKAGTLPKLKPRRHLAPQPSVVLKERLERALVPEVGGNEPRAERRYEEHERLAAHGTGAGSGQGLMTMGNLIGRSALVAPGTRAFAGARCGPAARQVLGFP